MGGSSLTCNSWAFCLKNNLTEINHKVSVLAKGLRHLIADAFAAKCEPVRLRREPKINCGGGYAGCNHRQLGAAAPFFGRDAGLVARLESSLLGFDRSAGRRLAPPGKA